MTVVDKQVTSIMSSYHDSGAVDNPNCFSTPEQWKALLAHPWQGKIVMITYYKYFENVTDSQLHDPAVDALLKRLTERFEVRELFCGKIVCNWVGSDDVWDEVSIRELPNCAALVGLCTHPEYVKANRVRPTIVARQRTVIIEAGH